MVSLAKPHMKNLFIFYEYNLKWIICDPYIIILTLFVCLLTSLHLAAYPNPYLWPSVCLNPSPLESWLQVLDWVRLSPNTFHLNSSLWIANCLLHLTKWEPFYDPCFRLLVNLYTTGNPAFKESVVSSLFSFALTLMVSPANTQSMIYPQSSLQPKKARHSLLWSLSTPLHVSAWGNQMRAMKRIFYL